MGNEITLINYDAARRALDQVKSVDEAKTIHDEALKLKAYARQAKDRDMVADAVEIQKRAEIRVGEMMAAQKGTVGLNKGGRPSKTTVSETVVLPTLKEAGIDTNLAKRARTMERLTPDEREEAVQDARKAAVRAMNSSVRRKAIEHERKVAYEAEKHGDIVADLNELIARGFKASVIYADPPWSFDVYSGKGKQRSAERHYDTMSLDAIKSMGPKVQAVANDDCALFLWAVWPDMPGALEVIEAWGFDYKTAGFVWVKTNADGSPSTGMGYWTRANSESCLLATKGSPQRLAADVHQVVMAPRGEHSVKPEEVRHRIERLLAGPYLELFGRRAASGWTVCGNQAMREAAE